MSVAVDRALATQAISVCGLGLAILGIIVARGVGARVPVVPCPR